jgi:nucleotide-binding universal stress UspA family protein
VLLVRPTGDGDWRRIVAAVDTTADDETNRTLNERIVDLALAFTTGRESQLEVVNAWIVYGEHLLREHMREAEFEEVGLQAKVHAERKLNELAMKFGMSIEDDCVKALHGDACEVIPATVNDPPADLLVMGTVGRSGISGLLLGNTAERILEKVDCSVLAVKPALSGVTQLTLAGASGVAAASAGAE